MRFVSSEGLSMVTRSPCQQRVCRCNLTNDKYALQAKKDARYPEKEASNLKIFVRIVFVHVVAFVWRIINRSVLPG